MIAPSTPAEASTTTESTAQNSYMDKIMNTQKKVSKLRNYRPVNHVSATAIICERLVSRSKIIADDLRGSMDPSTLENTLILRCNRDMWDVYLVQKIYEKLAQQNQKDYAIQAQVIEADEELSPAEENGDDEVSDE